MVPMVYDHLGIIVDNLDQTVALFQKVFGLPMVRTIDLPDRGIKGAFLKLGDTELELIEPTKPEVRKARLGEGIQARLEHIAVRVEDIEKAVEALEAQGVRMAGPIADPAGIGPSVFADATTTGGILFQLYQQPRKG